MKSYSNQFVFNILVSAGNGACDRDLRCFHFARNHQNKINPKTPIVGNEYVQTLEVEKSTRLMDERNEIAQ